MLAVMQDVEFVLVSYFHIGMFEFIYEVFSSLIVSLYLAYGQAPLDQPPEDSDSRKKAGIYFPSIDDPWRTKESLLLTDKDYDNVSTNIVILYVYVLAKHQILCFTGFR